jgi:uncharacterized protein (DUF2147 family)
MCGIVVWASAKAREDARRGSGQDLLGLELFREMQPDGPHGWRGRVFIPDRNLTLTGFAEAISDQALRVTGCLIGNAICKTQTWARLPSV